MIHLRAKADKKSEQVTGQGGCIPTEWRLGEAFAMQHQHLW